jgi:AcrR family transcriptional regulator
LTTRGKRSQGTVRRRLTRADREKQIVDIATASFSERGYLRTSMDEVAERCGISKPLLYEYFGSKEGLFLAAVEQVQAELDKSVAASLRTAITSTETLTSTMRAYFDFADSTPRFCGGPAHDGVRPARLPEPAGEELNTPATRRADRRRGHRQ